MSAATEIPNKQVYGFIGLGSMGYGMCTNLRSKLPQGTKLLICDINTKVIDRFLEDFPEAKQKETGPIEVISSPRELAEKADVILTILPRGSNVRDVYVNTENSLLSIYTNPSSTEIASKNKLFIDCTTMDAEIAKEVGQQVISISKGVAEFADSPVSGGPFGAAAGTLTMMVGCDEKTWKRVEPVCKMMGKNVFHAGEAGSGSVAKILNNYVSAVTTVASSEALNMGSKFGLDPKRLTEIISASGGQNWVMSNLNPCPEAAVPGTAPARGYQGGFAIELCRDVFKLGRNLNEILGTKTIVGPSVEEAFDKAAQDPRCAGLDARSIYLYIAEREAGSKP